MIPRRRLALLACLALSAVCTVVPLAPPAPVLAHGGPPLRLGVTRQTAVQAVARLALVHLREGVGFAVDWREYPDEETLRVAFQAGKLDLAVAAAVIESSPTPAPAPCAAESVAARRDALARAWGAEVFPLGFAAGPGRCAFQALIVSRVALQDPRFGILGKEAARLATLVAREDLAAVEAAAASGGERAATAAARAALAAKPRR